MRRRARTWLASVLAGAVFPAGVLAGSQSLASSDPAALAHQDAGTAVIERQPAPGVRLIMSPDPNATVLTSCLVLQAGTRSESTGELGFAELARAHVLTQTPGLTSPNASSMLAARNATLSNTVDRDVTSYCVSVPPREMPLALWLAARRLNTPLPTSQTAFVAAKLARDNALQALAESPVLAGMTKLEELAFQGYARMEAPPLASALVIDAVDRQSFASYFSRVYRESSAAVALVGRFDPEAAERVAREQFKTIEPRKPQPAPLEAEGSPVQKSPRYSFLTHERSTDVELNFGWVVPEPGTKEHDALRLANGVLAAGDDSRLRERLVKKSRFATDVDGWVGESRGPALFGLRVKVGKRVDLDAVSRIVTEEIQRLATVAVRPEELRRASTQVESRFVQRMTSLEERARELGRQAFAFGNSKPLRVASQQIGEVTPAEVSDAVRRYLGPYRCSLVEVYPKKYPIEPSNPRMKKLYLVRSGDTLIGIARAHGVPVDALVNTNGLRPKSPIYPGQKLVIPPGGKAPPKLVTHTVRKGDTLSGIAKKHGVSVTSLARANKIPQKKPISVGQVLVIPPKQVP